MEHPSGRFHLLKASELNSPSKCVICGVSRGSDNEESLVTGTSEIEELQFVDGRLDFEFYGTVYFCKQCTLEMASLYGSVHSEQYDTLLIQYENLIQEHAFTLERNSELEDLRNVLSAELSRLVPVSVVDGIVTVPEISTETPTKIDNGSSISQGSDSTKGQGDIKINELDGKSGLSDLLDDSGELKSFF